MTPLLLPALRGTARDDRHRDGRRAGSYAISPARRPPGVPTASAVAALRAHKDRQVFERESAGDRWQDHGFVFCSVVRTPLDASNVNARLHKILASAGLPRQRFHDLRHAAASLMLAGRVDLKTVSDALGHSQIGITANLYAHLAPALKRDAADALDTVLTGTG